MIQQLGKRIRVGVNNKVIHVVVGYDEKFIYMITAYYPSLDKFEMDLKTGKGIKNVYAL